MKKLLVILIFSPAFLIAQTKVNGIGLFKLGAAKSKVLDSICASIGYQKIVKPESLFDSGVIFSCYQISEVEDEFQVFRNKLSGLYKCKKFGGMVQCPLEEQYQISSLDMIGIQLKNIAIKFYCDTLYSFQCEGSRDLTDALNVKYGEGKLEQHTKFIYCQNNISGAQIQHEETEFITKWRWDKQVDCWESLNSYYNNNCEEVSYHQFYLENLKLEQEVSDCWDVENKKENGDKKRKLDKF